MNQLSLLIDATGKFSYIYLINENQILNFQSYENKNNLSYSLAIYLKDICEQKGYRINDIKRIYLVYGPGKFSAMRICSVVCKTIKFINNADLFILDKVSYLAKKNCYCIIESDGNKSYAVEFKDGYMQDSVRLIDNEYIDRFTSNKNLEIVVDNDNRENVIFKLSEFQKVNEEFELEYWKQPC